MGTFHLQKRACTKKGPVVEDAEKASVAGPQKGACGKSGEGVGGRGDGLKGMHSGPHTLW